jgi:hypothetical protein
MPNKSKRKGIFTQLPPVPISHLGLPRKNATPPISSSNLSTHSKVLQDQDTSSNIPVHPEQEAQHQNTRIGPSDEQEDEILQHEVLIEDEEAKKLAPPSADGQEADVIDNPLHSREQSIGSPDIGQNAKDTEELGKKKRASKYLPIVLDYLTGKGAHKGVKLKFSHPKEAEPATAENPYASLIRGYTTIEGPGQLGLQPRRTLDQYFYSHLKNTTQRDQDQVVYRYMKKYSRRYGYTSGPKILMVDQLWLWILNEGEQS